MRINYALVLSVFYQTNGSSNMHSFLIILQYSLSNATKYTFWDEWKIISENLHKLYIIVNAVSRCSQDLGMKMCGSANLGILLVSNFVQHSLNQFEENSRQNKIWQGKYKL